MSELEKFAATEKCLVSINDKMNDLATLALLMEMQSVEAIRYLYEDSELELEVGLLEEVSDMSDRFSSAFIA